VDRAGDHVRASGWEGDRLRVAGVDRQAGGCAEHGGSSFFGRERAVGAGDEVVETAGSPRIDELDGLAGLHGDVAVVGHEVDGTHVDDGCARGRAAATGVALHGVADCTAARQDQEGGCDRCEDEFLHVCSFLFTAARMALAVSPRATCESLR